MLIQLTQAQKKIMATGGIITLAFVFVWLFIFLPGTAAVNKTKTQLNSIETQIRDIEGKISDKKTLAQGIEFLELRRKVLGKKFPKEEEESFKILSEFARKFNIRIISLKAALKKPLLDEKDMEVKLDGKTCRAMEVILVMKCSYADLIKYRQMMEEGLPGFVTVERLAVVKDPLSTPEGLDITLDFNLYFLD